MENLDVVEPLLKTYFAQIISGIKISKIISEHRNEEELSPDSLITGLIYRLMVGMDDNEMIRSLQKVEKFFEEGDSDSDEEADLLTDILNTDIEDKEDRSKNYRDIEKTKCKCKICKKANQCLIDFQEYETFDQLTKIYKDAIKKTCKDHKLNII